MSFNVGFDLESQGFSGTGDEAASTLFAQGLVDQLVSDLADTDGVTTIFMNEATKDNVGACNVVEISLAAPPRV